MRNHRRKVGGTLGTTKISNSRRVSNLPIFLPIKRQRCHQEVEVYHRLYKDKINQLTGKALAESPIIADTDESTSDSNEEGSASDKASRKHRSKLTKDGQRLKAYRMKIKWEVLAKAWAGETPEVKEEIHRILEKEKEEKINSDKALISNEKSGLDRPPEKRQM